MIFNSERFSLFGACLSFRCAQSEILPISPLHARVSQSVCHSGTQMNELSASSVDDDSHSALHKRGRNQMHPYFVATISVQSKQEVSKYRGREYMVVSCFA